MKKNYKLINVMSPLHNVTATSMNSMERPAYPRTQYSNRVVPPHIVSCDPSSSQQNLMQSVGSMNGGAGQQTPDLPYGYDAMPSNYR